MPVSRRAAFAAPLMLLAPRLADAVQGGRMSLCLHTNTSAGGTPGSGYRAIMEGWAKAGIRQVELSGAVVDAFLKTDTIDAARRVLTDNGLTAVHGFVGQFGLIEPNEKHAEGLERLKPRLEKIALDAYDTVADQMRKVGETARAFEMMFSVEFVRQSPYMSTLLTALRTARQAAHPNFGVMFDFYHFWSGNNKLEDLDQIRPGEITHVHFQDVPDLPRELLDNNTRAIPGDGGAPVVTMLRKLAEKGYSGPLSVELFIQRLRDGSPYETAREIRPKCEAVMAKAGVA
jgi:sugar phosphate isomerase/epimerase